MTGDWDDWSDGDTWGAGDDWSAGGPAGFDGLGDLPVVDPVDGDRPVGHLVLDLDGVSYRLPVSDDLGPDAVEEAVTLTDGRGMAVCADTDGDGHVDRLSVVGFDGSWSSWERRPVPAPPPPPRAPTGPPPPPRTPRITGQSAGGNVWNGGDGVRVGRLVPGPFPVPCATTLRSHHPCQETS